MAGWFNIWCFIRAGISIFVASAALAAIGPSIVIALVSALAIVITTAIAAAVLHSY